jgi:hypothetical protein
VRKLVQVKRKQQGLRQDVEDRVEDHLRVGRNNISTLGQGPSDGVQEREEGQQRRRDGEASLIMTSKRFRGISSGR